MVRNETLHHTRVFACLLQGVNSMFALPLGQKEGSKMAHGVDNLMAHLVNLLYFLMEYVFILS